MTHRYDPPIRCHRYLRHIDTRVFLDIEPALPTQVAPGWWIGGRYAHWLEGGDRKRWAATIDLTCEFPEVHITIFTPHTCIRTTASTPDFTSAFTPGGGRSRFTSPANSQRYIHIQLHAHLCTPLHHACITPVFPRLHARLNTHLCIHTCITPAFPRLHARLHTHLHPHLHSLHFDLFSRPHSHLVNTHLALTSYTPASHLHSQLRAACARRRGTCCCAAGTACHRRQRRSRRRHCSPRGRRDRVAASVETERQITLLWCRV